MVRIGIGKIVLVNGCNFYDLKPTTNICNHDAYIKILISHKMQAWDNHTAECQFSALLHAP